MANGWSSRGTFVLAAIGAAVGLGNIWKFPYIAGTSGGGAFVLVYLLIVVLIATPILIAELIIGRRGGGSPPTAASHLARALKRHPLWAAAGWLGAIAGTLVLSYYSVIGGWVLAYVARAASGDLTTDPAASLRAYDAITGSMATSAVLHGVFMAICAWVVARGLHRGLELVSRMFMPALFGLLLIMVVYGAVVGDFAAGVAFFLAPDFSALTPAIVLTALGHAFFSIGVSMGVMIAFAAYLPPNVPLASTALVIAGTDAAVALLAGLAIFPMVFAAGLDPGHGPGLIFVTLPIAFAQMPAGLLFATGFFVLLALAALTSAIALLEASVAWVTEHGWLSRPAASAVIATVLWVLGLMTVASFGPLAGYYPLGGLFGGLFAEANPYALLDWITANVMVPIGALLITTFVAWRIPVAVLREELPDLSPQLLQGWLLLLRFVVPVALITIFVTGVLP